MARRRLLLSAERVAGGLREFSGAPLLWAGRRGGPRSWSDGPACRWELRTVALWGEEQRLRAVTVSGEAGILVDYSPRLLWPAVAGVAACLTVGTLSIWQTLRIARDALAGVLPPAGVQPGDRDLPEVMVLWLLLGFLSLTALQGLHAISKRTEKRFWDAVCFDPSRDRVRSGSLEATGHPLLGEVRRSAVALAFVAAASAIWQLPDILIQALCLLAALQLPRLAFSGRSDLVRRSELGWSLGFRDGQYAVVVVVLHAMFLWMAASVGRPAPTLDDRALLPFGFLLGALPLGLLANFLHSCSAAAESWREKFGSALRAGEYLLAIEEDREQAARKPRLFIAWLTAVCIASLALQALALLLAGEILLHAFLGRDLPGLEGLWIPYSLWFESAGGHAASGRAIAALTLFPVLAFPRVGATVWWLRGGSLTRAARSSSRSIAAEVSGCTIRFVAGPAWVRIPQLTWSHGPVVVLPETMLLRLTAGTPQAAAPGPLLALAAHECLHLNRYAARTFLSWLGASSIGVPGFFRLLEDPVGEEFQADELALAVVGKESLNAAIEVVSRRGLRAAPRWGRLRQELRWVGEIVRFHFVQGALGYAHPTPEARRQAIEAWTTKADQAPPAFRPPSDSAVMLAKIVGLALGLGASAASVAGWYLAFRGR